MKKYLFFLAGLALWGQQINPRTQIQQAGSSTGNVLFWNGTGWNPTLNLFWDPSDHRLGIGISAPRGGLDVASAGNDLSNVAIQASASDFSANGGYLQINKNSGVGSYGLIQVGDSTDYNELRLNPFGGAVRFYNQTPSTGATSVIIQDGAGQSSTKPFQILTNASGSLTFFGGTGGNYWFTVNGGYIAADAGQTPHVVIDGNSGGATLGVGLGSTVPVFWRNTADPTHGSTDTGLSRISAGVLGLGNGSASNISGELILTLLQESPRAFSNLSPCNSGLEGTSASVTDSTTNTGGATIAGGGLLHVWGYCNGTNWIVASGSGGGGGNAQYQVSGTNIGSPVATANFIPSTGILLSGSNSGTVFSLSAAADTSVIETRTTLQSGVDIYVATASASSTAYAGCPSPTTAIAYTAGMVINFVPDVNGAGGATSFNLCGLGTKSVKGVDGTTNPTSTDIVAGQRSPIWYDGTVFRLLASGGTANQNIRIIRAGFDGGASVLTTGKVFYLTVPFSCTTKGYNLTLAPSGTISIDVWKIAAGTAIPTVANTIISGSSYLAISSGTAFQSSSTAPFTTTTTSPNDIYGFSIQAVTGSPTQATVELVCSAS